MLFGPLGDVCVTDQAAEQRGDLWSDVQLLLENKVGRSSVDEFGFILSADRNFME